MLMNTQPPALYIVADGSNYSIRSRGKVHHRGTLTAPINGFEERGVLGAELTRHLKLAKMPTVLQVFEGGALVKPVEPPAHNGPAHA